MIELNVGKQKKYTSEKKNVRQTSVISFAEHVFVDLQQQSKKDLEKLKFTLRLCEKSVLKNALIGQFDFDFAVVYSMKEHAIKHQWVALSNPGAEDFSTVEGYMKLSISITGDGDKPIELKDDDMEEETEAIMPASMKPKFHQLRLHVIKGEHLPQLDSNLLGG